MPIYLERLEIMLSVNAGLIPLVLSVFVRFSKGKTKIVGIDKVEIAFSLSTLFCFSKTPEKNRPIKTAAIAAPTIAISLVFDDCVLSFLFCDESHNNS